MPTSNIDPSPLHANADQSFELDVRVAEAVDQRAVGMSWTCWTACHTCINC